MGKKIKTTTWDRERGLQLALQNQANIPPGTKPILDRAKAFAEFLAQKPSERRSSSKENDAAVMQAAPVEIVPERYVEPESPKNPNNDFDTAVNTETALLEATKSGWNAAIDSVLSLKESRGLQDHDTVPVSEVVSAVESLRKGS